MSVTVIIPAYNQAEFLTESVESVLAQTVKPLEIIVVNDGSTDNTWKVALNLPVDYFWQKHIGNHTPARAMNRGIQLSQGDFVVCLAADDKLSPDYFEQCLTVFSKKQTGIVYTGCQEFCTSTKLRVPRTPHHRFSVFREPHGQIGAMMVKREVYCAVGKYDESLHSLEDWDFFIRAGLAGWKIRSIKEPLHYARVHNGRVTGHVDISELHRKYRFMKTYASLSRVFDAVCLCLIHPYTALRRFRGKAKI